MKQLGRPGRARSRFLSNAGSNPQLNKILHWILDLF